jgi:hypothetical protein
MSSLRIARAWSRRGRAAAATLVAAGALASTTLVAPDPAHAGSYKMNNCRVPGAETGHRGPWTYELNANFNPSNLVDVDTCASPGGFFGLYLPGGPMTANSMANINLFPASDVAITDIKAWFYADARGFGSPGSTIVWADGVQHYNWSLMDARGGFISSHLPHASFQFSTQCGNDAGQGCTVYAYPIRVYGVQTTLSESLLPAASITGGALTTPGPKQGVAAIAVKGTDATSGVKKLEVLLDDTVVGTIDYARDWAVPLPDQKAGTCAYDHWNACPKTQAHEFAVDTTNLPDGVYALRVRATDAAGNAHTALSPQSVTIDNVPDTVPPPAPTPSTAAPVAGPGGPGGPTGPGGSGGVVGAAGAGGAAGAAGAGATGTVLTLNGVNGGPGATVKAAFTTRRSTIRSAYGKKVLVTGELVGPSGRAITGARVSVLQQDKMLGARLVPAGEVVTDGTGRFRLVTTATRSRTIRFGYRAYLESTDFATTIDVGLDVVPRLTLSTSRKAVRNGQAVRFRGSVAGAPANARKVVELQVKKGSRWMTFRTTRLREGRFSERYRFTSTHRRTTYVFRARVRQEAGFPFLTGHSEPTRVTVRG